MSIVNTSKLVKDVEVYWVNMILAAISINIEHDDAVTSSSSRTPRVPSISTNDTDYGFTVRKASEQLQISSALLLFQAKNTIIATWRRIWMNASKP